MNPSLHNYLESQGCVLVKCSQSHCHEYTHNTNWTEYNSIHPFVTQLRKSEGLSPALLFIAQHYPAVLKFSSLQYSCATYCNGFPPAQGPSEPPKPQVQVEPLAPPLSLQMLRQLRKRKGGEARENGVLPQEALHCSGCVKELLLDADVLALPLLLPI